MHWGDTDRECVPRTQHKESLFLMRTIAQGMVLWLWLWLWLLPSVTAWIHALPRARDSPRFPTRWGSNICAAAVSSPSAQALVESGPFPQTWVPLASVYELDGRRPNAVYFLNQEYVVYQSMPYETNGRRPSDTDTAAHWVVADAACPHRLAPLSEGRIVPQTGRLECAYHGWTFDETGVCTEIPQWNSEGGTRTLPVCRLSTYPTAVVKNILWVWPWPTDPLDVLETEDHPSQESSSSNRIPPLFRLPEYFVEHIAEQTTTYTRDVPYSYDTLLENIVDPSHVPFAHHGLQGTRSDAIPIAMSRPTDICASGFNFTFADRTMTLHRTGVGIFRAPFVVTYAAEFSAPPNETVAMHDATQNRRQDRRSKNAAQRKTFNLTTILIPTRPGWSRIIIFGSSPTVKANATVSDLDQPRPKKSLFARVMQLLPVWLLHQLSSLFLDSDLVFLHGQERERERRLAGRMAIPQSSSKDATATALLRRVYFMPAPADRCVVALRQWMHDYAHVLGPLPPRETNRHVLFDRWTQHSEQCKHCHQAATHVKTWRNRTYGVLAASVLLVHRFLVARLVTVACIGLLRLYHLIDTNLRQGDFRHYKNH